MRIFIDINHPSYFHFFRQFIIKARDKGQELLITARERNYIHDLFKAYGISYKPKTRSSKSLIGKFFNLIKETSYLYRKIKAFHPEIILSFASPYAAIAGKLAGKKVITFEDTEPDPLVHILFTPFSDLIITPACYGKSFGKKHLRFKGYKESAYMEPSVTPGNILDEMGINKHSPLTLIRFVSHHATHDLGEEGLSAQQKIDIVTSLSKESQLIISSEEELPEELKSFQQMIAPEKMHRLMAATNLFFGESSTMAAESALLGIPSIVINNKYRGYLQDLQQKYGLVKTYKDWQWQEALNEALNILKKALNEDLNVNMRQEIRKNATDVTALLLWMIENFPENMDQLKNHPEIIDDFNL